VTDTVDLHRITTGEPGQGPPVVLLHGLGEEASTWADLTARLPGRHTIALDLRGHGASPQPGTYTFDLMVADVLRALAGTSTVDIVVDIVGHSMGGYVASLLAGRHPELVRRLVLEDAPVPPESGPSVPDPNPPARPDTPTRFDWAAVGPVRSAARAPNPQWWVDIRRLPTPTLLVSGGPASHLDPARVAEAAGQMPAATFRTIPVGHDIHTSAPDDFAELVVPFLAV